MYLPFTLSPLSEDTLEQGRMIIIKSNICFQQETLFFNPIFFFSIPGRKKKEVYMLCLLLKCPNLNSLWP
jgi:hypothetical protein